MPDQSKSHDPHFLLISFLQGNPAMERGKLTEEYRVRPPAEGGPPVRHGPYFKLQGREQGRHFTRRVSAEEVGVLKEHISNFKRFNELTESVIDASVTQGRATRAVVGVGDGTRTGAVSRQNPIKGRKSPSGLIPLGP